MFSITIFQHLIRIYGSLSLLFVLTACTPNDSKTRINESKEESVTEAPQPAPIKVAAPVEPQPVIEPSPSESMLPIEHTDGEYQKIEKILEAIANASDQETIDKLLESLPKAGAGVPVSNLEYYSVIVSGSKTLQLPGNRGVLNVWIGNEYYIPSPDPKMENVTSTIAAVGEYALVEANAPDFEVFPETSRCVLLDPTGVDTKFYLTALSAGDFIVSATINLFNTADCSGAAIPKTANTLNINVTVNQEAENTEIIQRFIDTFWEKATEFWGTLLALIFGLILFLIRKHLKALFGYGKDDT